MMRVVLMGAVWALLAAGPAAAQGAPFASAPLGIDSRTPIAIAADAFELRTSDQVGVWSGAVEVVQGGLTIQGDLIEVHYYAPESEQADAGQSVSRLEARGNVRIVSPDTQAQSDWAIYDVAGQMMTMGGGVLLTRGPNLLRGSTLSINLATNVVRLDPDRATADADGPVRTTGGRVSGVFVPPPEQTEETTAPENGGGT